VFENTLGLPVAIPHNQWPENLVDMTAWSHLETKILQVSSKKSLSLRTVWNIVHFCRERFDKTRHHGCLIGYCCPLHAKPCLFVFIVELNFRFTNIIFERTTCHYGGSVSKLKFFSQISHAVPGKTGMVLDFMVCYRGELSRVRHFESCGLHCHVVYQYWNGHVVLLDQSFDTS